MQATDNLFLRNFPVEISSSDLLDMAALFRAHLQCYLPNTTLMVTVHNLFTLVAMFKQLTPIAL